MKAPYRTSQEDFEPKVSILVLTETQSFIYGQPLARAIRYY